MATLREIRRRIGGVKSTQKMTKAMKMVSAAKLRRAQDAVVAARPYAQKMKELLNGLGGMTDVASNPLFAVRPVQSVMMIVISSDRGMCGAFNFNIVRSAEEHVDKNYAPLRDGGKLRMVVVGRKGFDYFQKNDFPVTQKHLGIFAALKFSTAQAIADDAIDKFLNGQVDRVELVYNEFKSILHQHTRIEQYLPIPAESLALQSTGGVQPAVSDYIYEPSSSAIMASLIPKHLHFQIWRALLESNAAEQGARMTAMENATTNASDLLKDLQLSYNKARQASITKELLEIVAGAEALKSSEN
ncbi:MAG TPA: ATP synthase F1 subunit gamma [Bacteroidota bacterium]|nr:ATP synthase F1 subunit gamma [Bacteroidota bacterium]